MEKFHEAAIKVGLIMNYTLYLFACEWLIGEEVSDSFFYMGQFNADLNFEKSWPFDMDDAAVDDSAID